MDLVHQIQDLRLRRDRPGTASSVYLDPSRGKASLSHVVVLAPPRLMYGSRWQ